MTQLEPQLEWIHPISILQECLQLVSHQPLNQFLHKWYVSNPGNSCLNLQPLALFPATLPWWVTQLEGSRSCKKQGVHAGVGKTVVNEKKGNTVVPCFTIAPHYDESALRRSFCDHNCDHKTMV